MMLMMKAVMMSDDDDDDGVERVLDENDGSCKFIASSLLIISHVGKRHRGFFSVEALILS